MYSIFSTSPSTFGMSVCSWPLSSLPSPPSSRTTLPKSSRWRIRGDRLGNECCRTFLVDAKGWGSDRHRKAWSQRLQIAFARLNYWVHSSPFLEYVVSYYQQLIVLTREHLKVKYKFLRKSKKKHLKCKMWALDFEVLNNLRERKNNYRKYSRMVNFSDWKWTFSNYLLIF